MRVGFSIVGFLLEPGFAEAKALFIGYGILNPSLVSATVAFLGILCCTMANGAISFSEGIRSLLPLARAIKSGSQFKIISIIPESELSEKYGLLHRHFRRGVVAGHAGSLVILFDKTGKYREVQCAFNMFGTSYLIIPFECTKLEDLQLGQKFMVLHELGHASFGGGEIWIGSKGTLFGAIITAAFGIYVADFGWYGAAALVVLALNTLVTTRKVVIESEAEAFADRYALMQLAREDIDKAIAFAAEYLNHIEAVQAKLPPYEQLISRSRKQNLKIILAGLRKRKENRPTLLLTNNVFDRRWPSYLSAALLFAWIYFAPGRTELGLVPICVLALICLACLAIGVRAAIRMSRLQGFIRTSMDAQNV